MPRLKIESPAGTQQLILSSRLILGRADTCDVPLDDDKCSRKHCEFVLEGDQVRVRDLASSNGTFVNDEKIDERVLEDGDRVRLGATRVQYFTADADKALRFTAGELDGQSLPLLGERVTFGRRPNNTRQLEDIKVSGVHLEVVQEGDQFVLRDLGSTNGTVLDGRKVDEVALSHGDRVRFGEQEFVFVDLGLGEPAADASSESAPSARALTGAGLPGRGGKLGSILALVVLVALLGGAGWFFFFRPGGDSGGTVAKKVPPPPADTLLAEDWSFEDVGIVGSLWLADLGEGFRSRRGRAVSGGSALVAEADGAVVASVRAPVAIGSHRDLELRGSIEVEDGAQAALALRFSPAEGESSGIGNVSTVLVQQAATGGGFEEFTASATAPGWAAQAEVIVVARGTGTVRIDDLALLAGTGTAPTAVGTMSLVNRGGSFAMHHRVPLVEFFDVWQSTTTDEGLTRELPAGSFAVRQVADGTTIECTLEGARPDSLRMLVYPDVAAAGVILRTATSSARQGGSFEGDAVQSLILGAAAERMEFQLDPPCKVTGLPLNDGLQIRLQPPAGTLSVHVRGEFEAERREASELYVNAQQDARQGRIGAALGKYREIRTRLPYHEQTLADVANREAELLRQVNEERDVIEKEAGAAEFLDSLERYQSVLGKARDLVRRLEGSELVDAVRERVARIEERVEVLAGERRVQEAGRLERLAEAFRATDGRPLSAQALTAALQTTYADTAAAGGSGDQ